MILSQTISCATKFGEEKAIELIAGAGFDAVDYCMYSIAEKGSPLNGEGYKKHVLNLCETAKVNGVFFNQAHAVTYVPCDDESKKHVLLAQANIKAIEISRLMGIKCLVVHPVCTGSYVGNEEKVFQENMEYFSMLLPYAEENGVKLACENMWCGDKRRGVRIGSVCSNPYEHIKYVDEMKSEMFVACLDVGHCSIAGREAQDCIRVLGDRLGALHIHDNDYLDDMHTLPGLSEMNWQEITKALADVGYKGDFTFETDHFFDSLDSVDETVAGLKLAELIGRKLIKNIEKCRK